MRYASLMPKEIDQKTKYCLVAAFEKNGKSKHSTKGTKLAYLLNYCIQNRIAFTLYYVPGTGYFIEKGTATLNRKDQSYDYINKSSEDGLNGDSGVHC